MATTKPPKVFISYAWEDDIKTWVSDFATRLRSDGINAILDQWEIAPGDHLTEFMERSVRASDFVAFVCTPSYKRKSDRRKGGVGYEGSIITAEVFAKNNHRKFIPILRMGKWASAAPSWAASKLFIDLRGDPYDDANYQKLLNTLLGKLPPPPTLKDYAAPGDREEIIDSPNGTTTEIKESLQRATDTVQKSDALVEGKASPQRSDNHPSGGVDVGGHVYEGVIVTGSGNVINLHNKGMPVSPEEDEKKKKELELRQLESQAVRFELKGDFWNARKLWYQIRGIDPLFPRVDIKITELEEELRSSTIKKSAGQRPKATHRRLSPQILIAIIGASATIIAALLSSPVIGALINKTSEPTATYTPTLTTHPIPTRTKQPITPTSLPAEITDPKGASMVLVPAGNFTMGSNNGNPDEKPSHQIYLDDFYMDKYEVTNTLYRACVDADICSLPHQLRSRMHSNYYENSQFNNYPVIYIDWFQAKDYCEWRGAHLPTEAEWEKAARGTDGRIYPWGEGISCDRANYHDGNKFCVGDTTEVGSYETGKSPYGIYDMAGNASEWLSSLKLPYPYDARDGREDLTLFDNRIMRGGSFVFDESVLRVFNRLTKYPDYFDVDVDYYTGIRCANSP